jgi:hypothetical protein
MCLVSGARFETKYRFYHHHSEFISNKTIGVVTEDIFRNGEGFVTTSGMVRGVNTHR